MAIMIAKFSLVTAIFLLGALAVLSLTELQQPGLSSSPEVFSPGDWVGENQIKVFKNKVVLEIPQAHWATFTDTNSMDPFIDADAHAIEILPDDAEQIQVGDVIAYSSPYGTIIHRVIAKGVDDEGLFFIAKGDNNGEADPLKVRFADVRGVVVAVVY